MCGGGDCNWSMVNRSERDLSLLTYVLFFSLVVENLWLSHGGGEMVHVYCTHLIGIHMKVEWHCYTIFVYMYVYIHKNDLTVCND